MIGIEGERRSQSTENTMAGREADLPNSRQQAHAKLLQTAFKRPGVSEVMRVYEDWRQVDRGLDSYRAATCHPHRITTTDHANQRGAES